MKREDQLGCGVRVIKNLPRFLYFFLFSYLRGGSAEREDSGRRSKNFQNLYIIYGLKILIIH